MFLEKINQNRIDNCIKQTRIRSKKKTKRFVFAVSCAAFPSINKCKLGNHFIVKYCYSFLLLANSDNHGDNDDDSGDDDDGDDDVGVVVENVLGTCYNMHVIL